MTGDAAPPIVVMGVSASGKSAVGAALADRLGVAYVDADDLHPQANVDKMTAGIPLDDADRWPWLDAVAARLAEGPVVIACSALKRTYRDRLRAVAPRTVFVHLTGDRAVLEARIAARKGHFMPASLLQSQLETLEDPAPDEAAFALDFAEPVDTLVAQALERIR
ncbi:gluconokinase [Microbacterium sp.]|uniref:gluconokinase n=1 Tax=Microbacterium sp. TaxID=51671 RepID=UPI003A8D0AFD